MIEISCYISGLGVALSRDVDGLIHMVHGAWMVRLLFIPVTFHPSYTIPVAGLTFAMALLLE